MADKTDKNGQEKRVKYCDKIPTPKTLQILCLRKVGWTVQQVAQMCQVSERQVYRRCEELEDYFADLPAIQEAKDAIQCLIPRAVKVYEKSLDSKHKALAADVATKILISSKVIADRKVIEDEREHSTNELVSEAERILAGVSNSPAGSSQAQPDSDDSPRS